MRQLLVLVLAFAVLQLSLALIENRDVCILGGGIGGMGSAVFLRDRGYSVVVLEQADEVGGACDTVRFTPPAGQTVDWIDVGVQVFPNTTDANLKGRGPWLIDSVSFFARFGGGLENVIPFGSSTTAAYDVDMKRGLSYTPTPFVPDAAWAAALGRFQAVLARYPWVDQAQTPAVVPAELLVPFSEFIRANQLEPLIDNLFTWYLWSGGLGDWNQFTALYAVLNLGPTILGLTTDSQGITLRGGCKTLYDGIEAFLGERNVITSAQVRSVKRVTGQPSVVTGVVRDPSRLSYRTFQYTCDHVFIGFAPTKDKVSAIFDLNDAEEDFYKKVRIRPYFAVAVDMEGPGIDNQVISISNVDKTRTNEFPALPALLFLGRVQPYGPIQGGAQGRREIDVIDMVEVIKDDLDKIPSSIATKATVIGLWRHEFQPHYSQSSLAQNPSPPSVLRSLQGQRNTWVVGAVDSYASHVQILDRTLRLITANFPVKS